MSSFKFLRFLMDFWVHQGSLGFLGVPYGSLGSLRVLSNFQVLLDSSRLPRLPKGILDSFEFLTVP